MSEEAADSGWAEFQARSMEVNEESRRRQLREDGHRSLAVNLAEGLALTEFLSTFTGSAWNSGKPSDRLSDSIDLEALKAAQEDA